MHPCRTPLSILTHFVNPLKSYGCPLVDTDIAKNTEIFVVELDFFKEVEELIMSDFVKCLFIVNKEYIDIFLVFNASFT